MSEKDEIEDLPLDVEHPEHEQDAAEANSQQPESAKSSDARDATETDDSLLSVAREVIDQKTKKPDEAASSAEQSGADDSDRDASKSQDDENYSDVPFHKHPRFQQVLGRMKASEADAGRYRNVQSYLDSVGLSADGAAEALTIAGLMRTQPAEAWKQLQPILRNLLVAAGEALPPELQQRVDAGQLSHDAALEISRSQAGMRSVEQQRQFEREQLQRQQQASHAGTLRSAAESWETDRRAKDPNFDAKMEGLEREVVYLQHTEGRPNTVEGVRDQLKRAYDRVNKSYRPPAPPAPRRQPTRPVTGGQPAGSGAQKPVFNSTLDIIRAKTGMGAAS